MTASPGAPGTGPPAYQPAFQPFIGNFMNPQRSTPTPSTGRLTLMEGMSSGTGAAVGMSAFTVKAPVVVVQAERLLMVGTVSAKEGCRTAGATNRAPAWVGQAAES